MVGDFEFGFDLQTIIMIAAFIAAFASILLAGCVAVYAERFVRRTLQSGCCQAARAVEVQQQNFQQRKRPQPTRQEGLMRAVISKLNMGICLRPSQLKQKAVPGGPAPAIGGGALHLLARDAAGGFSVSPCSMSMV